MRQTVWMKKNPVSLFSKRKNKPEVHPGQDHQLTQPHSVFFGLWERTCEPHTERPRPNGGFEHGTFCLWGNNINPHQRSQSSDRWMVIISNNNIKKKSLVTFKMATKINDKYQWCIITHTNCSLCSHLSCPGDSDSTAVIACCCWGLLYGLQGVPEGNYANLEYRERLERSAEQLYALSHWGRSLQPRRADRACPGPLRQGGNWATRTDTLK